MDASLSVRYSSVSDKSTTVAGAYAGGLSLYKYRLLILCNLVSGILYMECAAIFYAGMYEVEWVYVQSDDVSSGGKWKRIQTLPSNFFPFLVYARYVYGICIITTRLIHQGIGVLRLPLLYTAVCRCIYASKLRAGRDDLFILVMIAAVLEVEMVVKPRNCLYPAAKTRAPTRRSFNYECVRLHAYDWCSQKKKDLPLAIMVDQILKERSE